VLFQIHLHQAVQTRQNLDVTARLFREQQRDRLSDAGFIQQSVDVAAAEQLPGVALSLFGNFHSGLVGVKG
jgi:hypothetical protein